MSERKTAVPIQFASSIKLIFLALKRDPTIAKVNPKIKANKPYKDEEISEFLLSVFVF